MKIFLVVVLFISMAFANPLDDGLKAYEEGNYKKAREYYTLAANQGYAIAQSNLGVLYYNGEGVRQDKRKAKEFFGKACDNGDEDGCKNYKILNEQGF